MRYSPTQWRVVLQGIVDFGLISPEMGSSYATGDLVQIRTIQKVIRSGNCVYYLNNGARVDNRHQTSFFKVLAKHNNQTTLKPS